MLLKRTMMLLVTAALLLGGCGMSRTAVPARPAPVPTQVPPAPATEPARAACSIPEYKLPPGSKAYNVYFHCGDSEKPIGLPRIVQGEPNATMALTELLKGPTEDERKAGFTSWFSAQTAGKLKSVTVDSQGRAIVDFANFAHIISGASSSAGSGILKRELGHTLAQFPEIKEIEYRFDGSCNTFGEWQQTGCIVIPASSYR